VTVSLEATFREEWPRAVGILTRVLGDLSLAEDAVQDAFAKALERWPTDAALARGVDRGDRAEPSHRPDPPSGPSRARPSCSRGWRRCRWRRTTT
jgi:hypothetical protein